MFLPPSLPQPSCCMTEAMHYHTHTDLSAFIKKKKNISNVKTVKCKITPITYNHCRTRCIYCHTNSQHCPSLRDVFFYLQIWNPLKRLVEQVACWCLQGSSNVKTPAFVTLNRWAVYEKGGGRWLGQGWGCKHVFWKLRRSGEQRSSQPGRTSALHHRRRSGRLLSCM